MALRHLARYGFFCESDYQYCLAKHLEEKGWAVRREVRCARGVADIYATKQGEALLIEAKVCNSRYKQAIKQLKKYAPCFPVSQLWFACVEDVSSQARAAMYAEKIMVVPTALLDLHRFLPLNSQSARYQREVLPDFEKRNCRYIGVQ